jgi:hypothetical protein
MIRKYLKTTLTIVLLISLSLFIFSKFSKKKEDLALIDSSDDEIVYNSNLIKDISYTSEDLKGNKYELFAKEGEIDLTNSNVIFLKDVTAYINLLKNSEVIVVTSDYGKYNTLNYDTIFSNNVKVDYIDNLITGEYLDFSMMNKLLIISKNVVYKNLKNILKADVVEVDIITKDTNIFMYDSKEKVKIESLN